MAVGSNTAWRAYRGSGRSFTATSAAFDVAHDPQPTENRAILVVDPDDDTRGLYRHALEANGHNVVEAVDGRDGLVKALASQPLLVITEARLPLVDGYSLCEILRRDRATQSVPILVITAEARPGKVQQALASGADVVLVKPADLDTILAETQRLIDSATSGNGDGAASTIAPASMQEEAPVRGRETTRLRTPLSKAHARFNTTTPPRTPPGLLCPLCDGSLKYQYSHIGGVSNRNPEQWDYYVCTASCGAFEYRQRTRKVRQVPNGIANRDS